MPKCSPLTAFAVLVILARPYLASSKVQTQLVVFFLFFFGFLTVYVAVSVAVSSLFCWESRRICKLGALPDTLTKIEKFQRSRNFTQRGLVAHLHISAHVCAQQFESV